jgi:hypothetical protein
MMDARPESGLGQSESGSARREKVKNRQTPTRCSNKPATLRFQITRPVDGRLREGRRKQRGAEMRRIQRQQAYVPLGRE